MPRQRNTRPTHIYWLYDTRPEMIAIHGPEGKPLYCGKTVQPPKQRLHEHRCKPSEGLGPRIRECGEYLRIQVMEIVPPDGDWVARERHWIATLRLLHPDCTNISDGGTGPAGYIWTAEQLAKVSVSRRGKKRAPEFCAKMREVHRGKKKSLEHRAKMSAAQLGKKHSPETIEKMSASLRGRIIDAEWRKKLSLAARLWRLRAVARFPV